MAAGISCMVDGRNRDAGGCGLHSEEARPLQDKNTMNSSWKTAVHALVLVVFFCTGIAHIVNPEWFIRRSGVRKGGDLLTEWNRTGFQIAGLIFAGLAAYLLYVLFRA